MSQVFPIPLPKIFSAQSASVSRSSTVLDIPFYKRCVSYAVIAHLRAQSTPVAGVPGLAQSRVGAALTAARDADAPRIALLAVCKVYEACRAELRAVLETKTQDREFIDQRTRACYELNYSLNVGIANVKYVTMVGSEDTDGRVVIGPKLGASATARARAAVAPLPAHLQGHTPRLVEEGEGAFANNWLSDFAIPSSDLLFNGQPLPAHVMELVLKLFKHWNEPELLTFYATGICNEEDARYLRGLLETAEAALKSEYPSYALGTARVIIAIDSPRAAFRLAEISGELFPFYAGAALDWSSYLAASSRLFRDDTNYQLPISAAPSDALPILKFLAGEAAGDVEVSDAEAQRGLLLFDLASPVSPAAVQRTVPHCLRFLAAYLSAGAHDASVRPLEIRNIAGLERARRTIWHTIRHKRIRLNLFLSAALQEYTAMCKAGGDTAVSKWNETALYLLILLVCDEKPIENALELLVPFSSNPFVQLAEDPWIAMQSIDAEKYAVQQASERFCRYFRICANADFASNMSIHLVLDMHNAEQLFSALSEGDILAVNSAQPAPLPAGDRDSLRADLWACVRAALLASPMQCVGAQLQAAMLRHQVTGASLSISTGKGVRLCQAVPMGSKTRGHTPTPVTRHTRFEVASLSKSIASCFAIEYFNDKSISLLTPVNGLLEKYDSPYRIPSGDPAFPDWGDRVTIAQLMDHSSLNMHYVNGIPISDAVPNVLDLITGSLEERYGYAKVCAPKEPGSAFGYSGGGFLVLQHLIEVMEDGNDIVDITAAFAKRLGMADFTFEQKNQVGHEYATAYRENGQAVTDDGRRMHPAFPAGGMGTALDLSIFLTHLTQAFNHSSPTCPISHDTAIAMLDKVDKGSQKFMGASMGLGIFVAEAGANKIAIHQGANDGFRCLFAHCYNGPDVGKGFVVHCNAELNGVLFISEVAQILFHELRFQGVDESKFKKDFRVGDIPSEQIVNMGYKELVFNALEPDNAEPILIFGKRDPWADYNQAVGGVVKEVTNQRFARAENLLSALLPTFEPKLFGRQGKVMDSWESVRHNPKPFDTLIVELADPKTKIHFVSVSTQFHLGNQALAIAIEGKSTPEDEWHVVIPRCELKGHAKLLVSAVSEADKEFSILRVHNIPDGGISRLGLFSRATLPAEHHSLFQPPGVAQGVTFADPVPGTVKPLAPVFEASPADIQAIYEAIPSGWEVDLATSALGGKIWSASDEHYGPAYQIISPYPPLSMFDGLETKRSREPGHFEDVVVRLARQSKICRIEIDMTYFVNNNPLDAEVVAACNDLNKWTTIVSRRRLKGYSGNFVEFLIDSDAEYTHVKVITYPDGGFNRLKIYGIKP
jgi:allantoicase/CubicO group peptidase (beta-lactamase class C family)